MEKGTVWRECQEHVQHNDHGRGLCIGTMWSTSPAQKPQVKATSWSPTHLSHTHSHQRFTELFQAKFM